MFKVDFLCPFHDDLSTITMSMYLRINVSMYLRINARKRNCLQLYFFIHQTDKKR